MFGLTSVLNARGICGADPVEALVDERHDLGAARVALGELVLRILRQRLHPFAHAALRVADRLQDRVHLGLQALQLALAQLVDLVRRHGRGRRRLERPAVELLAVRPRRDARDRRWRPCAAASQFGDLPIERGRDLLRRRSSARARPSRRECPSSAARWTRRACRRARAFFAESCICASALSSRNAGGTSPAARAAWMRPSSPSSCFAYDCSRARYASASAAFSMRWSLSRKRGMSRYAPTFWMTTYGVLRQPPTVMSPYGSANPSSDVAYALFTTSRLVRVACESPSASKALTRSRSARTCCAMRCCPSAERSASSDRSPARAPVSMPSEVAVSGDSVEEIVRHAVEQRERIGLAPGGRRRAAAGPASSGQGQRGRGGQRQDHFTAAQRRVGHGQIVRSNEDPRRVYRADSAAALARSTITAASPGLVHSIRPLPPTSVQS